MKQSIKVVQNLKVGDWFAQLYTDKNGDDHIAIARLGPLGVKDMAGLLDDIHNKGQRFRKIPEEFGELLLKGGLVKPGYMNQMPKSSPFPQELGELLFEENENDSI